jgi:hypothetical protein
VRQKGIEPPAFGSGGQRSVQLSYWRIFSQHQSAFPGKALMVVFVTLFVAYESKHPGFDSTSLLFGKAFFILAVETYKYINK